MKIKRYFAKDMRTALNEVKAELGADAVIMSNKKVTGGVEIVAAIDPDSSKPAPKPASAPVQASPQQADEPHALSGLKERLNTFTRSLSAAEHQPAPVAEPAQQPDTSADSLTALLERQHKRLHQSIAEQGSAPVAPSATISRPKQPAFNQPQPAAAQSQERPFARAARQDSGARNARQPDEMARMREEMSQMRKLLEHQLSNLMTQEFERTEPLRAMMINQLKKLGFAPDLADQMACYIPEDLPQYQAWEKLQQLVEEQLVVNQDDILRNGGVVALLGPTGVGKTTTVAKLAARYAQQFGADQVALVTTDTFRIGAHEQLATYGRIMGCPVKVAKSAEELSDALYQLRNRRLVLIDTAGMGQRDVRLTEQLATLMRSSPVKIKSYLVLSATAQRQVQEEAIHHFRQIPLAGCIFTKLDECLSLGEILSVAIQNALPIGYLTDGQRVPEDIRVANARYLVSTAFEMVDESVPGGAHPWMFESAAAQAERVYE